MLRKFYLVPQGLYDGLMADQNQIDKYPDQLLEETMNNQQLNASTKNALYNQRLHGSLKHKKNLNNRPVKVAFESQNIALRPEQVSVVPSEPADGLPELNTSADEPQLNAGTQSLDGTPQPTNPASKLRSLLKTDATTLGVLPNGRVLNDNGAEVSGSSVEKILAYLDGNDPKARRPHGTTHLLKRLENGQRTRSQSLKSHINKSVGANPNKKVFNPKLWKN